MKVKPHSARANDFCEQSSLQNDAHSNAFRFFMLYLVFFRSINFKDVPLFLTYLQDLMSVCLSVCLSVYLSVACYFFFPSPTFQRCSNNEISYTLHVNLQPIHTKRLSHEILKIFVGLKIL